MKLALVFLLVTVSDCSSLSGAVPKGVGFIPIGPILQVPVKLLTELLEKLPNCLQTALGKDGTLAAKYLAAFLCSKTATEKGELDIDTFRIVAKYFIDGMRGLGCVEPLSTITGGAAETLEAVKLAVLTYLKTNPVAVAAVAAACPAGVVFYDLYKSIIGEGLFKPIPKQTGGAP